MNNMRASTIVGKEVVTEGGNILGTVKDWEIDPVRWKVTAIVVRVRRDMLEMLQLKKPLVGTQEIVIATSHISGIANRVVLNKRVEQFAKLTGAEAPDEPEEEPEEEPAKATDE